MKKILGPGLLAGIAVLFGSMVMSQLINLVYPGMMKVYANTQIYRPWHDPLMNLYFVYLVCIGLVGAVLWNKVKTVFKDKKYARRACSFAGYLWLVSVVLGMIVSYSSFQISLSTILIWTAMGYVNSVIASFVLVKLNK